MVQLVGAIQVWGTDVILSCEDTLKAWKVKSVVAWNACVKSGAQSLPDLWEGQGKLHWNSEMHLAVFKCLYRHQTCLSPNLCLTLYRGAWHYQFTHWCWQSKRNHGHLTTLIGQAFWFRKPGYCSLSLSNLPAFKKVANSQFFMTRLTLGNSSKAVFFCISSG